MDCNEHNAEWKFVYMDFLELVDDYMHKIDIEQENTLDALLDLKENIKEQIVNNTYDD